MPPAVLAQMEEAYALEQRGGAGSVAPSETPGGEPERSAKKSWARKVGKAVFYVLLVPVAFILN